MSLSLHALATIEALCWFVVDCPDWVSERNGSHSPFSRIEVFGWEEKNFVWEKDERSAMKDWRAPLLGQLPRAETGYDTLNLTVECMTMAVCVFVWLLHASVHKCVFYFPRKWKETRASFNFTETHHSLVWVFKDKINVSQTQACHLYFVSCPQSLGCTTVCVSRARAHSEVIQESLFTLTVVHGWRADLIYMSQWTLK